MADNIDIQSHEARLLASMLESHGRQLSRIDDTLQQVTKILENLGRLEERFVAMNEKQDMDREEVSDHESRLKVLEVEMPALREVRAWVITGVLATVAIVGASMLKGVHLVTG